VHGTVCLHIHQPLGTVRKLEPILWVIGRRIYRLRCYKRYDWKSLVLCDAGWSTRFFKLACISIFRVCRPEICSHYFGNGVVDRNDYLGNGRQIAEQTPYRLTPTYFAAALQGFAIKYLPKSGGCNPRPYPPQWFRTFGPHFASLSFWNKLALLDAGLQKTCLVCQKTAPFGELKLQVPPKLTRREREITPFLLSGATRNEIASTLGVSPETVKQHIKIYCPNSKPWQ